jgi:hypothetical protein
MVATSGSAPLTFRSANAEYPGGRIPRFRALRISIVHT